MHPQFTVRYWLPQEDQYVRDHFLTSTVTEMATHLGRTMGSVRSRKTTLGLGGKWHPWTDVEVEELRAFYQKHDDQALNLAELARSMGRSVVALCLKAGDLGLSKRARPRLHPNAWSRSEDDYLRTHADLMRKEAAEALGRSPVAIRHRRSALGITMTPLQRVAAQRRSWAVAGGHPRGFYGHTHSSSARARIGARAAAMWVQAKALGVGEMSEENQQRRSDLMAARQATDPRLRQGYSKAAGGMRDDLGIYVRSRWEANVARYLKWLQERGEIHAWAYESRTFWFEHIKRGTRSYTPDFEIVEQAGAPPHFWEVKGWRHPRGETALTRMARYYPTVQITVIDEDAYKAIARWKALIPDWEMAVRARRV